jgi:hypothetical protein
MSLLYHLQAVETEEEGEGKEMEETIESSFRPVKISS